MTKHRKTTRRRFLQHSAAAAGCLFIPRSVLGAQPNEPPPSERLNIAGIGLGPRGLGNMEKCTGSNIVALCDVDFGLAQTAFEQYAGASKYRDFRKMLDNEHGIDAVVISTPDHTHAVIAAEAMKRGKHVFVETPMAHSVWETRELARIARKTGVTTQMGNERHSCPGLRRAVEMLWGGGLGPVKEVHCWTNRPNGRKVLGGRPRTRPFPKDWTGTSGSARLPIAASTRPIIPIAGAAGSTSARARWDPWAASCSMLPSGDSNSAPPGRSPSKPNQPA